MRARALHTEAITYLMPIMVAHAALDSMIRPPAGLEARELERASVHAVKRLVE